MFFFACINNVAKLLGKHILQPITLNTLTDTVIVAIIIFHTNK